MLNVLFYIGGIVTGFIISGVIWLVSHWKEIARDFGRAIRDDRGVDL